MPTRKRTPILGERDATSTNSIRLAGAELRLPVHYLWYNILRTLGWNLTEDVDDPARFAPAFIVTNQDGHRFPVVCEPYSYMPGDTEDDLANEAFREIEVLYPDGALLFFNGLPVRDVAGHSYTFGGCLFSALKWSHFAINEHSNSVDSILEQVSSGFKLGDDEPKWADLNCRLAAPATLMSYEVTPGENPKIMSLRSGDWRILLV